MTRNSERILFRASAAVIASLMAAAGAHAEPLHITFPAGLPGAIAPEMPHEVLIRIADGTQSLVPGSPAVHYRTGSGPFATLALDHAGGDEWVATLPGFDCGSTLDLYFSAEGDGGAVVHLPSAAPAAVFSGRIAFIRREVIHRTLFDTSWPAGWSATGIWHVTHSCAPVGNLVSGCEQGPWAYFGRGATCNYNIPLGTPGVLAAPQIDLPQVPPGGHIALEFCYALETSEHELFDRAEVFINNDTRSQWRIPDVRPVSGEPDRHWSTAQIDLTEFAGERVSISWRFSNIVTPATDRGWHLNNVRIIAEIPTCEAPCYANCDGSTTEPILTVDDFSCFIAAFAEASSLPHAQQIDHYANCDGSMVAPVLTVDDFTCFINAFAQGCP